MNGNHLLLKMTTLPTVTQPWNVADVFKWAIHGLFLVYFRLFIQALQILLPFKAVEPLGTSRNWTFANGVFKLCWQYIFLHLIVCSTVIHLILQTKITNEQTCVSDFIKIGIKTHQLRWNSWNVRVIEVWLLRFCRGEIKAKSRVYSIGRRRGALKCLRLSLPSSVLKTHSWRQNQVSFCCCILGILYLRHICVIYSVGSLMNALTTFSSMLATSYWGLRRCLYTFGPLSNDLNNFFTKFLVCQLVENDVVAVFGVKLGPTGDLVNVYEEIFLARKRSRSGLCHTMWSQTIGIEINW